MGLNYAEVEAVLARMFHAGAATQGAFRGRLGHLRRLGIPIGLNPGKGKRIAYELEQIYQLGFCLELEEMGLDPSLISRLIKKFWTMLYRLLVEAEHELGFSLGPEHIPDDLFFAIYPKFMSGQWDRQPYSVENFPEFVEFLPFRITDAAAALSNRRMCTLNLSAFIRAIRQSFMDVGAAEALPEHLRPGVAEARAFARATPPRGVRA